MAKFFTHKLIAPFFHRDVRRSIENWRGEKKGPFPNPLRKSYPRLPRTKLPAANLPDLSFKSVLERRKSFRNFSESTPLSLEQLATLLYYSFGVRSDRPGTEHGFTFYPSGGARYPLTCYVAITQGELVPPGLYHYNAIEHSLEHLLPGPETRRVLDALLLYPFVKEAPAIAFVTATWRNNFIKYEDFGYPVVLLETGHAAHNLLLAASAIEVGTCPVAGFLFDETCELLDIDGILEAPVYAIALGKVSTATLQKHQAQQDT
jgi:SagB-type dehydrogenase family enzyme